MSKNLALSVAGIVFTVIAVVHAYRLYANFDIVINGYSVPSNLSIVGLVISGVLALWMFMACKSHR